MTDGRLGHAEWLHQVAGARLVLRGDQGEQTEAGGIGKHLEPSGEQVGLVLEKGRLEDGQQAWLV